MRKYRVIIPMLTNPNPTPRQRTVISTSKQKAIHAAYMSVVRKDVYLCFTSVGAKVEIVPDNRRCHANYH